jgi:hypothetical protein
MLGPLEIAVRRKLPSQVGESAAGCFLEREGRIVLLPYSDFKKARTWFKAPITRSLYHSLAAHEAAHALAACNFSIIKPTLRAKEYLAYVTTFVTMEPELRGQILKRYPGPVFKSADRLSTMLYMFDPMRFGVESYRHYLRPENGDRFLRQVLAGSELKNDTAYMYE